MNEPRNVKVLDIDGKFRENPDFPVAVVRQAEENEDIDIEMMAVDPIFNYEITRNLYGRIMTLVEATCESHKLKAVKDLFGKGLKEWESDVYASARELANGGNSSSNLYTRGRVIS